MPQIVVDNLVKTFRIAERRPGVWGALAGLAHRRYRTVTALDGVSFSLEEGELLGYIGPNGAGKSTTVKILSGILVPDSGQVTGVVIAIDRNQDGEVSEEQLEISQRLASLGRLAARVAHELNNPLDGILRYINLALRVADDPPESKLKSYLSESRTGLMRMVQIISELLEFSRTTDGEFDELNVKHPSVGQTNA